MDLTLTPAEEKFRDESQAWLDAHVPREWHDPTFREALTPVAEIVFLRSWQRMLYDGPGPASPGHENTAEAAQP